MTRIEDALLKAKAAREQNGSVDSRAQALARLTRSAAPAASTQRSADGPAPDAGAASLGPTHRPQRHIQIDREAFRRVGFLAPDSDERRLADEYRQIKRPLLDNASGRSGLDVPRANLVMISGAMPGEGKTFTCVNLALSIAREKDWRVLLVDGDITKRHLTTLFDVNDEIGLLGLVRDPALSIDDVVIETDIPGLSILPAGQRDEQATELLASKRMEAVAKMMSEADPGCMVLFDSPPLLVTPEASVLATYMGQIVMVVKAGHTTRPQVQHAVAMLNPEQAVGLVLNQAKSGGHGAYGYYGYGADGPADDHDVRPQGVQPEGRG